MKNKYQEIKLKDLLIVIVLYQKKLYDSIIYLSLLENLNSFNDKLQLFIYDNSQNSQSFSKKTEKFIIKYIHDPQNSGVTKAYNQGFQYAKIENKNWVLLFDQDTCIPKNYLTSLFKAISQNPELNVFSPILKYKDKIVSPFKIKLERGKGIRKIQSGIKTFKNYSVINSGLCLRTELYSKTNGYNESIKLDFSDISFIKRLSKHEKKFLLMPDTFNHELSAFSNSKKDSLIRFERYCNDAKNYALEFNVSLIIYPIILLRAFKQTIRFWDYHFLFLFFNKKDEK